MNNLRIGVTVLLFFTYSYYGLAQTQPLDYSDTIPEDSLILRVNEIYTSNSMNLIFNLKSVPIEILTNLAKLSARNGLDVKKLEANQFMATGNDPWEATDHISNQALPRRKFLFAIQSKTEWIVLYLRGDIGSSLIIIYSDSSNNYKINAFCSRSDVSRIYRLERKNKLKKLLDEPLTFLVGKNEISVYNGAYWAWAENRCYL